MVDTTILRLLCDLHDTTVRYIQTKVADLMRDHLQSPDEILDFINHTYSNDQKIKAVKYVQTKLSLPLKEAKNFVETPPKFKSGLNNL